MTQTEERIEAMHEILNHLAIEISDSKVKELTEAFTLHLEMEREMSSYQYIPSKHDKGDCSECKSLKYKLEQMTAERDVYHNSVCRRRNTTDVWLEGDDVRFNL